MDLEKIIVLKYRTLGLSFIYYDPIRPKLCQSVLKPFIKEIIMPAIPDYVKRVVSEFLDLHEKVERLDNFLSDEKEVIDLVGISQYRLLRIQFNSMTTYCMTLHSRLHLFATDIATHLDNEEDRFNWLIESVEVSN